VQSGTVLKYDFLQWCAKKCPKCGKSLLKNGGDRMEFDNIFAKIAGRIPAKNSEIKFVTNFENLRSKEY